MQRRLSKQAVENLAVADRVEARVVTADNGQVSNWFAVAVCGQQHAVLHAGDGFVMLYPTYRAVVKAVRRLCPDLPITVHRQA